MFDAELYRDKSEVDTWKARDPIATFVAALEARGAATEAAVAALDASVSDEVDRAVRFAEAAAWEPVEDLAKDVYTPAEAGRALLPQAG
jgi:pyruvate dehydrogenase E1 component alpha subunit